MKNSEMNKLMAWLIGAFPQWKPDKGISAVWAGELPDIEAEAAIQATRRIQEGRPSPFPPGVFEIVAALSPKKDSRGDALIAFQELWNTRKSDNPLALKAYSIIGQDYGQCMTNNRDWHEKRFVEIYQTVVEKERYDAPALPGAERKQLEGAK